MKTSFAASFRDLGRDGRFDLVAFIEAAQHVILLRFVIVIVHVDTKLYFFNRNNLSVSSWLRARAFG